MQTAFRLGISGSASTAMVSGVWCFIRRRERRTAQRCQYHTESAANLSGVLCAVWQRAPAPRRLRHTAIVPSANGAPRECPCHYAVVVDLCHTPQTADQQLLRACASQPTVALVRSVTLPMCAEGLRFGEPLDGNLRCVIMTP